MWGAGGVKLRAVIIAQRVIDGVIPDKSKKLESEIKRERHLTKIMFHLLSRSMHV